MGKVRKFRQKYAESLKYKNNKELNVPAYEELISGNGNSIGATVENVTADNDPGSENNKMSITKKGKMKVKHKNLINKLKQQTKFKNRKKKLTQKSIQKTKEIIKKQAVVGDLSELRKSLPELNDSLPSLSSLFTLKTSVSNLKTGVPNYDKKSKTINQEESMEKSAIPSTSASPSKMITNEKSTIDKSTQAIKKKRKPKKKKDFIKRFDIFQKLLKDREFKQNPRHVIALHVKSKYGMPDK